MPPPYAPFGGSPNEFGLARAGGGGSGRRGRSFFFLTRRHKGTKGPRLAAKPLSRIPLAGWHDDGPRRGPFVPSCLRVSKFVLERLRRRAPRPRHPLRSR